MRFRATAVAVLSLSLVQPSSAFDLSFTARAEAGLDPATREFINTLPQTWRPQIAQIVEDALNRVDKSVKTYLVDVDKLLTNKIQEAQCAVVGGGAQLVDTIAQRFPWVKKSGPMVDLREHIVDEEAKLRPSHSPTAIKDVLNDISLKASIVSCQNFAVATARSDAKKIIDVNSRRWLAWNRLASFSCDQVQTCIGPYRDELAKQVAEANAEDLKNSGAESSLRKFNQPKKASWWSSPLPFAEYEVAVLNLYTIESALGAAKAVREAEAIKMLDKSEKTLDQSRVAYNSVRDSNNLHVILAQPVAIPVQFKPSQNPGLCAQYWGKFNSMLNPARQDAQLARKLIRDAELKAPIFAEAYKDRYGKVDSYIKKMSSAADFCA